MGSYPGVVVGAPTPAFFSPYQLVATDAALPTKEVMADMPGLIALDADRDMSA